MGMNSHVIGIRPPDEDYKRKLAAWEACEAAGVDPPTELRKFFGYTKPNAKGEEINLEKDKCCEEYRAEMQDGFTIDIRLIPEGVRYIRFYNSY